METKTKTVIKRCVSRSRGYYDLVKHFTKDDIVPDKWNLISTERIDAEKDAPIPSASTIKRPKKKSLSDG